MKYSHVYRDGVQMWPIGIICIKRIRGFGFGFIKERGSDALIGGRYSFYRSSYSNQLESFAF